MKDGSVRLCSALLGDRKMAGEKLFGWGKEKENGNGVSGHFGWDKEWQCMLGTEVFLLPVEMGGCMVV